MAPSPRRAPALGLALVLVVSACAGGSESDAGEPGTAPSVATTSSVTTTVALPPLEESALEELRRLGEDTGSTCLLVQRNGSVVHESYFEGRTPDDDEEIWSATKSIASTLVGIAQHRGHLHIDEPASTYLTEWQGTASEDVTIRDLLANASGRLYDGAMDYYEMARSAPDKTAFSIALDQQHPPGEVWEYNNSAIQTLEAVLERATGQDVEEFAKKALFEPLGMSSTIVRDATGNPLTFMGVQASCRDLAQFGQLALQRGEWEGEMLVQDDWFDQATAPATDLNQAYGFLWWLNRPGRVKLPVVGEIEGPMWRDAPEDAFAAAGLGGQTIAVYPAQDTVVVRLATGQGGVQGQGNFVNDAARILFGPGSDAA
jgi:CubicO group peptidase (beta-lactamase class C family)